MPERTRNSAAPRREAGSESGFTLIELMVVVAILGLVARTVIANFASLLPEYQLDSSASIFADFLATARTEAQLRAEPIDVEIDMDLHRYRLILPPELRVTRDQPESEKAAMDWVDLDEFVAFDARGAIGSPVVESGRVVIAIDHNGFMADQVVVMTPRPEGYEQMVWSLQFRGLERGVNIVRSREGDRSWLSATNEGAFR